MSKRNRDTAQEMYNAYKEYINSLSEEEKENLFLEQIYNFLESKKYVCYQKDIKQLYNTFKNADRERKGIIVGCCIEQVMDSASIISRQYNRKLCERFGHIYGSWKKYEESHLESAFWYDYVCKIVDEEGWKKTCIICGNVEKTTTEPPELREIREKRLVKERKSEIKRLEARLAKLKAEQEKTK